MTNSFKLNDNAMISRHNFERYVPPLVYTCEILWKYKRVIMVMMTNVQAKNELDLVQQQLHRLQYSVGSSSDEVTQLRVENELFRIEIEARTADIHSYEAKLAEVLRSKVMYFL